MRSGERGRSMRHAVWLLALVWSVAAPAKEERIGLVLGGGGARGAAHIGVLKVLERERVPVHAIAGTSVGAIIGGLYAAGYSPEEIEQMIGSIDWIDIFRDETARVDQPMRQKETDLGSVANLEIGIVEGQLTIPTTLVRGQKLGLLLRRMFLGRSNIENFDDLPIPFRCVATDIGVVRPVVFSTGDLALAVRASMAVPGAFAPVRHEGKVLVDGGIVDNVPIDVARQMGVDRLIVVDVGQPLAPAESVQSGLQIMLQMVSGMMRDRSEDRLATLTEDDVFLRPTIEEVTSASFPQAIDAVGPGEAAAEAVVDRLRTFSVSEAEYAAWQATQHRRAFPAAPEISFVNVDASRSGTAEFVRDRVTAEIGGPLDIDALEQDIRGAFGRGTYDSIIYRMATDQQGRSGLDIIPVDTALGRAVFRTGFQINDDFQGNDDYQLNVEGRVTGLTEKGAEWRTFLGMGRVSTLETDFYLPFAQRGNWFVAPLLSYYALNQPLVSDEEPFPDQTIAQYRVETWYGEFRIGRDFGDRLRLSAAVLRGQDHAELTVGLPDLFPASLVADVGGVNATLLWDSLDNVRFPRRGMRAEVSYTEYDSHLGSDEDGNLLRISFDKAFSSGRNTLLLGARASLAKDPVGAEQTSATLGGLTYLSGLRDRQLIGDQMLLLRSVYYRRLTQQALVFDVPMYLAGSLEGGNVWEDYDDVSFGDLIGAGSVFLGVDLPVGPLQFGYGRTFDGRSAVYLTFGSLVLPGYR